MRWCIGALAIVLAAAGLLAADYLIPGALVSNTANGPEGARQRMAERIRAAEEKSQSARGVYMSASVANDPGRAAMRRREDILALLENTELNAVVIDVKETEGGLIITDRLRELIRLLHERGVWVIARQAVFKDSSQEQAHPEWYLKRRNARLPGGLWHDNRGGSWLDQSSSDVWAYQLAAAKAASDAGFDEIQFDYIRFPSDGEVKNIVYPVYDVRRPKHEVLGEFFAYLSGELKAHRPDLILSADLFGYVALQEEDLGIGQRLRDIGENFDYVSLMVYPSHYYSGFQVAADPAKNLPALFYPYRAANIAEVAASRPYEVVYRSLLMAQDILAGRAGTSADKTVGSSSGLDGNDNIATSSVPSAPTFPSARRAKLRPWLQDFDLATDSARGIHYDAKKVRAQIDAAEAAGSAGWLLWSPTNIYTKEALKLKIP